MLGDREALGTLFVIHGRNSGVERRQEVTDLKQQKSITGTGGYGAEAPDVSGHSIVPIHHHPEACQNFFTKRIDGFSGLKKRLTYFSSIILASLAGDISLAAPVDDAPHITYEDPRKLVIHFFGSSTCGECHHIRTEILKPLSDNNADILDVRIHDIDDEDGFQLLDAMEKAYDVVESLPIQLYFPDTLLAGGETIIKYGPELITKYLADPSKWHYTSKIETTKSGIETLRERFQRFSFLGIVAAGLVDGVNPCAIATMIFLISFLATQKRKKTEVLVIGLSFTLSVFITYLLIGIGALKVLTLLDSYRWLSKVMKWSAVLLAGGVGVMSFYDAAAYAVSGKASSIKLQLPKSVKLRIHRVISENLTGSKLIIGAIITGFLVTLLEAVCTGQVYLPTLVLMTRQVELKLQGWLYLILYNFLFVLPLLVVMLLAYWGLTWKSLSSTTQKHLPIVKTLLGIVLVGLAVFLGVSM